MMPCCLDLEMKWSHVINQTNFHKVVRIAARFRAMRVSAIEDTRESIHCLQEGRHAEVVE
jgi:3'-phosphoadenosine 5'-phosphosulfate sulfotransferase